MGKKEALVVGAGPSGLAAAINLQRDGFAVTVWEQEKEIGGNPSMGQNKRTRIWCPY